jgi:hypothetical protein
MQRELLLAPAEHIDAGVGGPAILTVVVLNFILYHDIVP